MSIIKYQTGVPTESGMYAVRVEVNLDSALIPPMHRMWEDKFLVFMTGDQKWGYPSSDQNYRGEVKYWVGPLQRKMV